MVATAMADTAADVMSQSKSRESRMSIGKSAVALLCTPLTIAGIAECKAAELSYDISAGARYSDNIRRSADQEIDETAAVLGLQLDWTHESNRSVSAIRTDIEYLDYVDGIVPNETVGSANANLDLSLVKDFFDWKTEGQIRTLVGDPLQPDNPLNRENVTQLSTSPELHFRLGKRTTIEVISRYRLNSFEVSDIDNDVFSGQVGLVRALTPFRRLSLNLLAERVEYDNTQINSNYDRQSATVGFSSEISKGTLDANIGWNEIHDNGTVLDGVFADFSLSRKISARSTLSASFSQQLSDGGNIFSLGEGLGQTFSDTLSLITNTDRFEYRQVSVAYNYLFGSMDFNLSAQGSEEEYESESANDREMFVIRAQFSRTLGSGWEIGVDASIGRTDFSIASREDDDQVVQLRLTRRLTEKLDLNLSASRFERDSSDPLANYTENSAALTLSYSR